MRINYIDGDTQEELGIILRFDIETPEQDDSTAGAPIFTGIDITPQGRFDGWVREPVSPLPTTPERAIWTDVIIGSNLPAQDDQQDETDSSIEVVELDCGVGNLSPMYEKQKRKQMDRTGLSVFTLYSAKPRYLRPIFVCL